MFLDYEKIILWTYRQKRSHNMLPSGLMHSTRAKLKNECLRLCKGKLHPKDEKAIRDFCEEWDNAKNCWQNISKCDTDNFRPLSNFLKGKTESTDFKNIELLAWLIGFPDRPFDDTKDYSLPIETKAEADIQSPGDDIPIIDGSNTNRETNENIDRTAGFGGLMRSFNTSQDGPFPIQAVRQKRRFRNILMVGALLAFLGIGSYWLWGRSGAMEIVMGNGGCMYWTGDRYQPTPCNKKIPNVLVIALDMDKVRNFKRITLPDTITHRAKGSVWYSKIDNRIEFFTADGDHPVVIDRHLKPISDYIIDTYIHPGMTSN